MTKPSKTGTYEKLIMDGVKPIIRELLLVDVANLISYLTFDQHHQIADLVDSACEQFFAPGFVGYREAGSIEVTWDTPPSVKLEMVINAPCHSFEFMLILERATASVKLLKIHDAPTAIGDSPQCSPDILKRAIQINSVKNHMPAA